MVSYELREEHPGQARANIEGFFGKIPDWVEMRVGDVADVGASGDRFDRVVLDLPEPWASSGAATRARAGADPVRVPPDDDPGPAARAGPPASGFLHIETFEVLQRGWHVTERSVRPDHRMVGHTGFLTLARVAPGG